jgi:hypothetical protein
VSGLGEILEENSRLRDMVRERDGQLADQAEQLAAHTEQIAALKASNERFALHFEFLENRRQMAAAERLEAAERQSPLFDGLEVQAPPRDPELEKADHESTDKPDGRKTAGTCLRCRSLGTEWTRRSTRRRANGAVATASWSRRASATVWGGCPASSPWLRSTSSGVNAPTARRRRCGRRQSPASSPVRCATTACSRGSSWTGRGTTSR